MVKTILLEILESVHLDAKDAKFWEMGRSFCGLTGGKLGNAREANREGRNVRQIQGKEQRNKRKL